MARLRVSWDRVARESLDVSLRWPLHLAVSLSAGALLASRWVPAPAFHYPDTVIVRNPFLMFAVPPILVLAPFVALRQGLGPIGSMRLFLRRSALPLLATLCLVSLPGWQEVEWNWEFCYAGSPDHRLEYQVGLACYLVPAALYATVLRWAGSTPAKRAVQESMIWPLAPLWLLCLMILGLLQSRLRLIPLDVGAPLGFLEMGVRLCILGYLVTLPALVYGRWIRLALMEGAARARA